jgi:hypothetical protein
VPRAVIEGLRAAIRADRYRGQESLGYLVDDDQAAAWLDSNLDRAADNWIGNTCVFQVRFDQGADSWAVRL